MTVPTRRRRKKKAPTKIRRKYFILYSCRAVRVDISLTAKVLVQRGILVDDCREEIG